MTIELSMKSSKILFIALTLALLASIALPALAQGSLQEEIQGGLTNLGTGAGLGSSVKDNNLPAIVGKIINVFLSILGVLFVVLMVYGGYTWMTSFGNSQKVDKAKELIVDAIIGLIIILAAYAIAGFVVGQLMKATTT